MSYELTADQRAIKMSTDPFDSLFSLEDQYYEEGYQEGRRDGLQQSELEARLFGIEKGFEKFVMMGKLQARAKLYEARLPKTTTKHSGEDVDITVKGESESTKRMSSLPILSGNPRLEKHVSTLLELVDSTTLSTANTDDAVGDFDERLRRAQAKIKIIERMIGEEDPDGNNEPINAVNPAAAKNMEDFGLR